MNIPIILGTARQGRQSEKAANFILAEVRKTAIETELIDVRDYRIDKTDNTGEIPQAKKLAEKITKADALIIVSPEYNFSYPGELKMMLDMLFSQYAKKPVGICGVSNGNFGGIRMAQKLYNLIIALNMVPLRVALYFPKIQELFNDTGEIKDESYYKRTKEFLDQLVWYAKNLKTNN